MPDLYTNGYGPQTNFEAWRQKGGPLVFSESSLFALQQAVDNPQAFSKRGQSARKNLSNLFGMQGAYSYEESQANSDAMRAGVIGENWLAQHEYSEANGYQHHMPIHPITMNIPGSGTVQFTGQTDFIDHNVRTEPVRITDTKFAFFYPWYNLSRQSKYENRFRGQYHQFDKARQAALKDFIAEKQHTYSRSPQALLYSMGVPGANMQFDMRVYNKPSDVIDALQPLKPYQRGSSHLLGQPLPNQQQQQATVANLESIKNTGLPMPLAKSVFDSAYNDMSDDERLSKARQLAKQGISNVFTLYGQNYGDITKAAQDYGLKMQSSETAPGKSNSVPEQTSEFIDSFKMLMDLSDSDYASIEPAYLREQVDQNAELNTLLSDSGETRWLHTQTFKADPQVQKEAEDRYWKLWNDKTNWGGQPDEKLGGTTGIYRVPFASNSDKSFGTLHQQLQSYYAMARSFPELSRRDKHAINLSHKHWAKGEDEYAKRIAEADISTPAGNIEDQIISEKLQAEVDSDKASFKADKANKRAQLEERYPGLDASKITRVRTQDSLDKVFHDLTQQGKALVQAQKEEEQQSKKVGAALSTLGNIRYFNPYRIRDEAQNQWGSIKGAGRGILPKDFENIGTRFGDYLSAQLNADTAQGEGVWNAGSAIMPSVLGSAAGLAATAFSGGNAALGIGVFQGVKGLTAGVSQGLGNKRQADVTQYGQQVTANLNVIGLVKNIVTASFLPLKTFASLVTAAGTSLLSFIGSAASFIGKGVSGTTYDMGQPLMTLTSSGYGDYQTSTRADMLIGASRGSFSSSVQDWRQQANMLYTQGRLSENRTLSAVLAGGGGFGDVYNSNSENNAYTSMYSYIDRIAQEMLGKDAASASKQMTQLQDLDPTIAKLVQRVVTNAQIGGKFEGINTLINPDIRYHKFTDAEYNTYEKDRVKYSAYKDSFDISKMRIAVALWDKIGDRVANFATTLADLIANGDFSQVSEYIKDIFTNDDTWKELKDTVSISIKDLFSAAFKGIGNLIPELYEKIKPLNEKIFDFIYSGITTISSMLNTAFSDLFYKINDIHIDWKALLTGKGDILTSKSQQAINDQNEYITKYGKNKIPEFKDTANGRQMEQNAITSHIFGTLNSIQGDSDQDILARSLGVYLTQGTKPRSRDLASWYDIVSGKIQNGEDIGIYLNRLQDIDANGYYTKDIQAQLKDYNLSHNTLGKLTQSLNDPKTRDKFKDMYTGSWDGVIGLLSQIATSAGTALSPDTSVKKDKLNVYITVHDEKTGKESTLTIPYTGVFGVDTSGQVTTDQFSLIASYTDQAGISGGLNQ